MELINYSDLKLKISDDVNTFDFCGNKIEVFKYLNIQDKYDLVMIALQKSLENGIYNSIKLDMYFHLNLVYMYSNLVLTDEDKENESKLYDELVDSGFMSNFLSAMEESEYNEIFNYLNEIKQLKTEYNKSIVGLLTGANTMNLSKQVEEAMATLKDFNPNDYPQLRQFAEAAGLTNTAKA